MRTWSKTNIFFPSNAFMAFARSLHTFNRSRQAELKFACKAVNRVSSLKRAGSGPIQSPAGNPIKDNTNQKRTKKTKTNNQNKNQQKKTEKGLRPAV